MPTEGVAKEFQAKIQRTQVNHPWKAQVVMSPYAVERLPRSMAHEGVTTLCIIESSLSGVKLKMKNHHWWNSKEKHSLAEFVLKVIPGSADIKFQLWSNQKIISKDHQNLKIVWNNTPQEDQLIFYELSCHR